MFLFGRKGVVVASYQISDLPAGKAGISNQDEVELTLIDAGAEDITWLDDTINVITDGGSWTKVRDTLKEAGFELQEAGLKYVASQEVDVNDVETAKKIMDFIEALEEDEDVSEVHTNANISEEIAGQL